MPSCTGECIHHEDTKGTTFDRRTSIAPSWGSGVRLGSHRSRELARSHAEGAMPVDMDVDKILDNKSCKMS